MSCRVAPPFLLLRHCNVVSTRREWTIAGNALQNTKTPLSVSLFCLQGQIFAIRLQLQEFILSLIYHGAMGMWRTYGMEFSGVHSLSSCRCNLESFFFTLSFGVLASSTQVLLLSVFFQVFTARRLIRQFHFLLKQARVVKRLWTPSMSQFSSNITHLPLKRGQSLRAPIAIVDVDTTGAASLLFPGVSKKKPWTSEEQTFVMSSILPDDISHDSGSVAERSRR
eukprot:284816201_6